MAARADADWAASVRVRSDVDLERQLTDRLASEPRRRSVWVTDLVDPRSAYFRQVAPVEATPEQRARLDSGRQVHERLEFALAEAPHLEVRVQRDGVVGQIDLFETIPVEVKTTGSMVGADGIRSGRPAYLEQLGIYCALVGRTDGRLLLASTAEPLELRAFDVRFTDLHGVWEDAVRTADELRGALEKRTVANLPACAWRDRGCPYQAGRVCECTGAESPLEHRIAARASGLEERPAEAERLLRRWSERPKPGPSVRRFRDLLYPRRAFFELTAAPGSARTPDAMPPADPDGLYRRLAELLESGPPGEVTRLHTGSPDVPEPVACYRGDPYLLKVSRSWQVPPPAVLLTDQPHYFLELGLRCAALGRSEGWLILGYERSTRPSDRLRVYRVTFDPLSTLATVAADRRSDLEAALARADPSVARACPAWMARTCAYRDRCRCGEEPAIRVVPTGK